MQAHDTLPYVIAAYAVAWTVLASYGAYLWRLKRRLERQVAECE